MLLLFIATYVAVFMALWTGCYAFLRLWDLEDECCCRIVTALHAICVTGLAGWAWYLGPNPFSDPGGPSTYIQELTLAISLGYFVFDLGWCFCHRSEGATMLIHHACSIIIMSRVLFKGVSGTEATAGVFCLEITNPLLQARWFLRYYGYQDTVIFIFVELIFMVMFLFFRMIWGSYLCYTTFIHPRPDWESKVSAASFYVLSCVFMFYIARYFSRVYIMRQRRGSEESVIPSKTLPESSIHGLISTDDIAVNPSTSYESSEDFASGTSNSNAFTDDPSTSSEYTSDQSTSQDGKEKTL